MAFTLASLVGPRIVGGDWNCTPADLQATGWLKKVGGVIRAHLAATCNGKVYDFFVVAAPIADAVHSVHRISDAGLTPHSPPARLILNGLPRATMTRQIKAPRPIPAILPHGPLQQQTVEFDALVEFASDADSNYAMLTSRSVTILFGLMGIEEAGREKLTRWEKGDRSSCGRTLPSPRPQTASASYRSPVLGGDRSRGSATCWPAAPQPWQMPPGGTCCSTTTH